jgi:hypothetical protein
MHLQSHVMESTRLISKAIHVLSASVSLAALFSNPVKTAIYATSAIPKKRTNMSVIDANKKLTGSSRFM